MMLSGSTYICFSNTSLNLDKMPCLLNTVHVQVLTIQP